MSSSTQRNEAGQTTVLIVGLAVVLLMVIGVVVDATAAYLHRQGLTNVADGAALAGADAGSRNEESLYDEGIGSAVRLEQQRAVAEAAVIDYLRATGAHAEYPGLTWEVAFDPARDSVMVSIRAPLDLPLTVPGSPERASISARAAAVVQLD
ncbi:MAG: pilus assembly protein TadG-related protein [Nocardioides sp.]